MKIVAVSIDPVLTGFLIEAGKTIGLPSPHEFTHYHGSIMNMTAEAIVSPANSFGFMDGGIDLLYSQKFGWEVEETLQNIIRDNYKGELLVGQATMMVLEKQQFKYLIAAPTMRIPKMACAVDTYLATRAAVRTAAELNIRTMVIPGMGTGTGQVPKQQAAFAMVRGMRDALDPPKFPDTLREAVWKHREIGFK